MLKLRMTLKSTTEEDVEVPSSLYGEIEETVSTALSWHATPQMVGEVLITEAAMLAVNTQTSREVFLKVAEKLCNQVFDAAEKMLQAQKERGKPSGDGSGVPPEGCDPIPSSG